MRHEKAAGAGAAAPPSQDAGRTEGDQDVKRPIFVAHDRAWDDADLAAACAANFGPVASAEVQRNGNVGEHWVFFLEPFCEESGICG
jgi:hypothetical protein